ncbi:hypothetical protein DLAC_03287 [Tieghemostelium lacteum]|uniref:Uncharacterized protein n=1 Tax=Tieghemostelium lacteum TaxID=361077 RepID=A0A152A216_TIELA|nr:hypothetical protein DLAC_03287 [Tieghemostelium lacteum]|eukprot:KYR00135.1 hypothetical protein DLAC_03287 [Tieghemostelium lacteum]
MENYIQCNDCKHFLVNNKVLKLHKKNDCIFKQSKIKLDTKIQPEPQINTIQSNLQDPEQLKLIHESVLETQTQTQNETPTKSDKMIIEVLNWNPELKKQLLEELLKETIILTISPPTPPTPPTQTNTLILPPISTILQTSSTTKTDLPHIPKKRGRPKKNLNECTDKNERVTKVSKDNADSDVTTTN